MVCGRHGRSPSSEMRKLQPDLENVEEQLKPAQLRQIGSITLLYRTPSEISSSSFQNRVTTWSLSKFMCSSTLLFYIIIAFCSCYVLVHVSDYRYMCRSICECIPFIFFRFYCLEFSSIICCNSDKLIDRLIEMEHRIVQPASNYIYIEKNFNVAYVKPQGPQGKELKQNRRI